MKTLFSQWSFINELYLNKPNLTVKMIEAIQEKDSMLTGRYIANCSDPIGALNFLKFCIEYSSYVRDEYQPESYMKGTFIPKYPKNT